MSRYIDADALREKWLCLQGHDFSPSSFVYSIDNEPTVDAVPLSYIYKRAMELKNDDMIYAYTVLNSLIANYRADVE